MPIASSTITSKGQTTIPIEVRKMLGLKANTKVFWISLKPGEITLVSASKKPQNKSWAESLCGKYKNDRVDSLKSLLESRQEDLKMEERGYL